MPRRNQNWIASKKFVRKEINEAKWSRQYITTIDLDDATINAGITHVNITEEIINHMIGALLFNNGASQINTDGSIETEVNWKLDYIKFRVRVATGESEIASAVSQTVRVSLFRSTQDEQSWIDDGPLAIYDDEDGNIKYDRLYGNKFGIYSDQLKYIHSWAADSDTTAGGQVIFKKFCTPKASDSFAALKAEDDPTVVRNDKGILIFAFCGDDPSGENSKMYGWLETGWRYELN